MDGIGWMGHVNRVAASVFATEEMEWEKALLACLLHTPP